VKLAAIVLFGWAAWLGTLAAMLWIWSAHGVLEPALLTGGAVAIAAAGAYVASRARPAGPERRIADSSVAAVVLAVGAALAAFGLTAGLWLILIGAEVAAFGLAGLVRELRAERRGEGRR
jgi:hypothetical protein